MALDGLAYLSTLMDFQVGGLLIVLIGLFSFLFKRFRTSRYQNIILVLSCIILAISLFLFIGKMQSDAFKAKYRNKTCEELQIQFEADKIKGEFAIFIYGIAYDPSSRTYEFEDQKDLKITPIHQGCIGSSSDDCYNIELEKYIKELKAKE